MKKVTSAYKMHMNTDTWKRKYTFIKLHAQPSSHQCVNSLIMTLIPKEFIFPPLSFYCILDTLWALLPFHSSACLQLDMQYLAMLCLGANLDHSLQMQWKVIQRHVVLIFRLQRTLHGTIHWLILQCLERAGKGCPWGQEEIEGKMKYS